MLPIRAAITLALVCSSLFGLTMRINAAPKLSREVITAANASKLQPLFKLGKGVIRHLDWSPDGKQLFVSTQSGVYIYYPLDLKQEPRLLDPNGSQRVVFNRSGTKLATFAEYGSVSVWDAKTLKLLQQFPIPGQEPEIENGSIKAVWFDSSDFPVVASNASVQNADKNYQWVLYIYSTQTKSDLLYLQPLPDRVRSIEISSDGKLIAIGLGQIGASKPTQLWDLETKKQIGELPSTKAVVNEIALSDTGQIIATANGDIDTDFGSDQNHDVVVLWDTITQKQRFILKGHSDWVRHVIFRPGGYFAASGSSDGTVRLWNIRTGEQTAIYDAKDAGVEALAFDPTGAKLAVATDGGYLSLWEVNSGKLLERIGGFNGDRLLYVGPGHPNVGCCIVFSRDSHQIAMGQRNGLIRVWETATGTAQSMFYGHTAEVAEIVFANGGRTIISSAWDNTLRYWNTTTTKSTHIEKLETFISDLFVSNDEKYLLLRYCCSSAWRYLYSVSDQKKIWDNTKFVSDYDSYHTSQSVISPDSKLIAYSAWDTLYIHKIDSPVPFFKIQVPCGRSDCNLTHITKLAFSQDTRHLLIVSDGTVRALDLERLEIISMLPLLDNDTFMVFDDTLKLAAFESKGQLIVQSLKTGEILNRFETIPYIQRQFNQDGSLLTTVDYYAMLRVWSVGSGIKLAEFSNANRWNYYRIEDFRFSPDGTLLAVADNEDVITVYGIPQ